ncbi:MAG: hypothetical protein ACOX1F_00250 [Erysipelotrichaceae bacterium]|jgi:hypothetical protein
MMFEKFIAQLTAKAQENNVDAESLIKTYQNRYQLGLEAGLSEEEIVSRFCFCQVKNAPLYQMKNAPLFILNID